MIDTTRVKRLKEELAKRILVIDGAMGTALQAKNLTAKDFGGEEYEGCNENLILTRPDVIESVHENYLKAGCDIVETNTFGATPLVMDEYHLGSKAYEINVKAAQIARRACEKYSKDKMRFVAGSIGPTTKAISVTGGATFEELIENFYIQAKGLIEGGSDYLLVETCQDTRNIKAALVGIDRLSKELQVEIPVAISVTIEPMGTMLAGQSIEALLTSVMHRNILYLGLNCATGPEFMTDHIRSLSELSPFPVSCVPNAGLPDENGCYLETPEMVGHVLSRFMEKGWVNVLGGCCGTTHHHIQELVKISENVKPHVPKPPATSVVSGVDYLEITNDMRPVIVGERTNVIGSKKFKKLICEEKFDEAAEVAKAQVKSGAHIIDICLANPDRNEFEDVKKFLEIVVKKIRVPLMIDSTDEKVIAMALTYSQGKALINSINLEDGEERYDKVLPLVKEFGAAVVVGTIDDDPIQGMGVSRQRKLEIAEKSYKLLTEKWGISPSDIYWDVLVFPCATGDAQYVGSAVETIEGIRLVKERFPLTKTILGVSNVSFGLPNAGREVLNSVFLYHCVQAGLDLAIVNAEKLERYASIPEIERKLSEDLLYNRGEDPVAAFAAHFRTKKVVAKETKSTLPLMERIPQYIIEGAKDGLIDDLNEALKTLKPLEVINGPLMKGMDEVGRLFNKNQLIVAEVLQSAEAMKFAVSHLEPFMEKTETSSRGKVVLATVKGDVHDIGKNLVEIIFANNGFQVINLGIKIPPEQLIQAVKEHNPDLIGLSGLLVKSAQQMVVTADDLSKAGSFPPMLVGGAALSENFVNKNIAPAYQGTVAYANDAMSGLELAKKIVNADALEVLKADLAKKRALLSQTPEKAKVNTPVSTKRSDKVPVLPKVPTAPDFQRHVLKNTPIDQIWGFINPMMLLGRHLGIQGHIVRKLTSPTPTTMKEIEEEDPKAFKILQAVEDMKNEFRGTEIMQPRAVFQFFHAGSFGNTAFLSDGKIIKTIEFPRQSKEDGLSLADYLTPLKIASPKPSDLTDSLAAFVVTVGKGVREMAEQFKNRGDYLKSHILQALAMESAEAYAEYLHSQIRKMWGHEDKMDITMLERFQAKYHGKRYSFGYPACPRLDDQVILWELLKPTEIGVELTDGFMMDPEASVSALVFHHEKASYFSVGLEENT